MEVYEYRVAEKFDCRFEVTALGRAIRLPCLVLMHPNSQAHVNELWQTRGEDIRLGNLAVLVFGSAVYDLPEGCDSPYFHCLTYSLPEKVAAGTLVERRFIDLIRAARERVTWRAADMHRDIWSIVEREPWPEYLVAVYLGLLAGMPETVPEDIWTRAWQEYDSLAPRFLMKERASKIEDLKCDVAKIRQMLERVHALHQT
jgi:hypothetical protein